MNIKLWKVLFGVYYRRYYVLIFVEVGFLIRNEIFSMCKVNIEEYELY